MADYSSTVLQTHATTMDELVRYSDYGYSSKIFAPNFLAAFTSAAQTSDGDTRPSSGDQTAPNTSSAFINGQRSLASPGDTDIALMP